MLYMKILNLIACNNNKAKSSMKLLGQRNPSSLGQLYIPLSVIDRPDRSKIMIEELYMYISVQQTNRWENIQLFSCRYVIFPTLGIKSTGNVLFLKLNGGCMMNLLFIFFIFYICAYVLHNIFLNMKYFILKRGKNSSISSNIIEKQMSAIKIKMNI